VQQVAALMRRTDVAAYTDGSARREAGPIYAGFIPQIEDPKHTKATAAVMWTDARSDVALLQHEAAERQLIGIRIELHPDQLQHVTSTTVEVVAAEMTRRARQVVEREQPPTVVRTNSEAACRKWARLRSRRGRAVARAGATWWQRLWEAHNDAIEARWIQSHVERREQDRNRWTAAQWGNWVADRHAGKQTEERMKPGQWTVTEVQYSDVVTALYRSHDRPSELTLRWQQPEDAEVEVLGDVSP
jgi:hypothetical protein